MGCARPSPHHNECGRSWSYPKLQGAGAVGLHASRLPDLARSHTPEEERPQRCASEDEAPVTDISGVQRVLRQPDQAAICVEDPSPGEGMSQPADAPAGPHRLR